MYQTLVLIHILSAIIGVGPTFFAHVLFRKEQSISELRSSLSMFKKLEIFPKIGGTLAVITGIILYFIGEWGAFTQLWLLGTLILYILIQILIIAFIGPKSKKLRLYLSDPTTGRLDVLPSEYKKMFYQANRLFWLASTMGVLIFILMILKPSGL
ncbi:DUF2269 family protein [Filobacillus milosensis]|uniref:DUF2269 family protein n=1 Tax=Filobacillus milosensis TaxID=94137 RepID=A0A4Y8IUR5_9BACI|nr:DUF2269 family protein [Filobacillus milosensis]TFB22838.1 DUF2269 family protein [Filobacillus milosensis]